MRPSKAETVAHGCHRSDDMAAVRMRKVLDYWPYRSCDMWHERIYPIIRLLSAYLGHSKTFPVHKISFISYQSMNFSVNQSFGTNQRRSDERGDI